MKTISALLSGMAGATALTLIHETARRKLPNAPRMDLLGMRAIARAMRAVDQEPPPDDRLHDYALAGDLVSNSLYYSLVGLGKPEGVWLRETLLGLAAGAGAILLPRRLGLGEGPSARSGSTQLMTLAWYLAGGLAAAAASRWLAPNGE